MLSGFYYYTLRESKPQNSLTHKHTEDQTQVSLAEVLNPRNDQTASTRYKPGQNFNHVVIKTYRHVYHLQVPSSAVLPTNNKLYLCRIYSAVYNLHVQFQQTTDHFRRSMFYENLLKTSDQKTLSKFPRTIGRSGIQVIPRTRIFTNTVISPNISDITNTHKRQIYCTDICESNSGSDKVKH